MAEQLQTESFANIAVSSLPQLDAVLAQIAAAATLDFTLDRSNKLHINRLEIRHIRMVAEASVDFDLSIFEEEGRQEESLLYRNIDNNLRLDDFIDPPLEFRDIQQSQRMYCRVINTDPANASSFFLTLRYIPKDPIIRTIIRPLE